MTNRTLVLSLALTLGYVAIGLFVAHRRLVSSYADAQGRLYPGFIYPWDWTKRPSPAEVPDDAEVVAYVSSIVGYGLFPHEDETRGKWRVRRLTVAGRSFAVFARYDQPQIGHYTPFFADHRERPRTILMVENAMLGNWDLPPTLMEELVAAVFWLRCDVERWWPASVQFDVLGDMWERNRRWVRESEAKPNFREITRVDGRIVDEILEKRLLFEAFDGIKFTAIDEQTQQTLRQFVRDGNQVWILSVARSEPVEPLYAKRMARARLAISAFADAEPGVEHLYYPPMDVELYRDHGHMNPAGSVHFQAWLGAQLDARDQGGPLLGSFARALADPTLDPTGERAATIDAATGEPTPRAEPVSAVGRARVRP